MTFRPFTSADRAACLALFDSNTPPFFDPSERVHFEGFLDGDPQPYFVLEQAGEVIACGGVALYPDPVAGVVLAPTDAGLKWGIVARARHGQGLGVQLLDCRTRWLRDHRPDVTALLLATSQHTRPFYERRGFTVFKIVPDSFAPGLDEVQMRLDLRPGQS